LLETTPGSGSPASTSTPELVATWMQGGGTWTTSPPLTIPAGARLVSTGPATGVGMFVLLRWASGGMRLFVVDPGGGWRELPNPPPSTSTVAFGGAGTGGAIDALVASGSLLRIWTTLPGAGHWTAGQVLQVDIQYGSSS
jgi:hypothetical protein